MGMQRYGCAPEGIVANLLPHFAGSPRDIFEERLSRQVINPKQDFPNPVSQRGILQKKKKNKKSSQYGRDQHTYRAGERERSRAVRTALDGMPSMRMSRRSFFTLSSTSSGVRDFEDSFGCERILLKACAVAAKSAAEPIVEFARRRLGGSS